MKQIIGILVTLAVLALTSCGDDNPHFTVKCRLTGIGSQGVDMVYTDPRGVLKRVTSHPDAKEIVEFTGVSESLTLAEFYTSGSGTPVMAFPVKNGDKIEARMAVGQPATLEIKGPKLAREYIRLTAAADSITDTDLRNAMVRERVEKYPDEALSAFMLMTRFYVPGHELEADSLLSMLKPEVRPQGLMKSWATLLGSQTSTGARSDMRGVNLPFSADSMHRASLSPGLQSYGLLAVTAQAKSREDIAMLRSLRDSFPNHRLAILEVCVQPDSAVWRSTIARDSAKWLQGWAPGGVSSATLRRLQVPRIPYYIVTDSTGAIIYRGDRLDEAASLIRQSLSAVFQAK